MSSPAVSNLRLLAHQLRYEQRSYWRNPAAAFFTFAFPLVFYFILTSVFRNTNVGPAGQPAIRGADYYTPSILAYAVMSACFVSIAMQLTQRRDAGILKRLRGTPLPSWALIGGVIANSVVVAVALSVIALAFGRLVYGVSFPPSHLVPLAVTIVIAATAFCALGVAVSGFIPNADAGPAVINLPFFVLVFISGTYFDVTGGLAKVANFFPLRPFIQAMFQAIVTPAGASPWKAHYLVTIAIWGVVGAFVATRRFRWTRKRG